MRNFSEVAPELEQQVRELQKKLAELQKSSTERSTKLTAIENTFKQDISRLQRSDTEISSKVSSLREDTDNLRKKLCLNLSARQQKRTGSGKNLETARGRFQ
uniref:uncharacterized protein isoform X2 n=1 Tax=Pristiophorus japonicus TaxID=55135 RepID=UPI00398EDC93